MTTTPYDRDYSFKNFQAGSPDTPLPGDKLDQQLDNVSSAVNSTQTELAKIQRSDGALANGVVTATSLTNEVLALVNSGAIGRGDWAAFTTYTAGDLVNVNDATYLANSTHTSSASFTVDDAAGYWTLFATPIKGDPRIYTTSAIGDGVAVDYPLPVTPASVADVFVFLNGVFKQTGYSLIGNVVRFTAAPGSGVAVDFRVAATLVDGDATVLTGKTVAYYDQTVAIEDILESGVINIKEAGCVGDGVTDDTTRFQQLINIAASTGQALFVPPAESGQYYKITSALTFSSSRRIRIYGSSTGKSLIKFTHAGIAFNVVSGGIDAQNLALETPNATPLSGSTAFGGALTGSMIRDVDIGYCDIGINANGADDIATDKVYIHDCNTGVTHKNLSAISGANIWFSSMRIETCTKGMDLQRVTSLQLHGAIRVCGTALTLEEVSNLNCSLVIESCTSWVKIATSSFGDNNINLIATNTEMLDLSGNRMAVSPSVINFGLRVNTRTSLVRSQPYNAGIALGYNDAEWMFYWGVSGSGGDNGAFKGLAGYAERLGSTSAGIPATLRIKRAAGFNTDYFGTAALVGQVSEFIQVKANTMNIVLPTYADEAAAAAGGLITGDLYVNSSSRAVICKA